SKRQWIHIRRIRRDPLQASRSRPRRPNHGPRWRNRSWTWPQGVFVTVAQYHRESVVVFVGTPARHVHCHFLEKTRALRGHRGERVLNPSPSPLAIHEPSYLLPRNSGLLRIQISAAAAQTHSRGLVGHS